MSDPDPGKAFPGGEIYLSMPGLGDRLAARIAGEIGEHIHQLDSPNARQYHTGSAPVTRRSGKGHHAALRALSNPWLEILWHRLTKGVLYDEATHQTNHNRALRNAA